MSDEPIYPGGREAYAEALVREYGAAKDAEHQRAVLDDLSTVDPERAKTLKAPRSTKAS